MRDASQTWIGELSELRDAEIPCAMVVVFRVEGSAPREVGARMLVTASGLHWGTIGGGNLEHLALEAARSMLDTGQSTATTRSYPLGETAGQCCGGRVELMFECFPWTRRRVFIFGAGHVGQALGGLAPWLGAQVTLIDSRTRDEIRPSIDPAAPFELVTVDAPEGEVDGMPNDALVLVMTHSHALDQEIMLRAVRRGFPYLGLIGSERKWSRFRSRLGQRGVSQAELDAVRCPIGVASGERGSKEPHAIALAVASELVTAMAPHPGKQEVR